MGVEVKGAGDGVVIADRGCNDGCGYDIEIIQDGALVGEPWVVHW